MGDLQVAMALNPNYCCCCCCSTLQMVISRNLRQVKRKAKAGRARHQRQLWPQGPGEIRTTQGGLNWGNLWPVSMGKRMEKEDQTRRVGVFTMGFFLQFWDSDGDQIIDEIFVGSNLENCDKLNQGVMQTFKEATQILRKPLNSSRLQCITVL